ncbi:Rft-1-domain-containing protein [Phellopilus nigrolimitatus]|nr:Rft-1-domain-containing protein [Phellopilus nigrolimitatus]
MSSTSKHPEQMSRSAAPNFANGALRTASSLMGLQLFSRLVTFALNQALVRLASPAVYGTVSIQLELLLNTILFLSREGFRNALLRADVNNEEQKESPLVSNIALLPVYFGVQVSFLTSVAYLLYASEATKEQPYFNATVVVYTVAAVLELFSEPMHIKSVQSLNPAVRIRAEGSAVIVKSITAITVLAYNSSAKTARNLGLLAFALGQLMYSITLLLVYVYEYKQSIPYVFYRSKVGRTSGNSSARTTSLRRCIPKLDRYFDENLLEVSVAMTAQGFVKHILTEGDKIIISRISPLKDQGGYAVANNYGALIARILFQPIEETSRLFFSKAFSSSGPGGPDPDSLQSALSRLGSLLLIYNHLSLLLLTLAPPYLNVVLSVALPPRYLNTSAPAVLSAWVWYIPVLAVNGILEAFVSSVASSKDIAKQSKWMAGASVAYILLTIILYSLANLGDTAVVYANIANLVARIIYCFHFISSLNAQKQTTGKHAEKNSWGEMLPPLPFLISCGLAGVVTRTSARVFNVETFARGAGREVLRSKACLLHICVGATCGLVCLTVCFLTEKQRVKQLVSLFSSRSLKKMD